MDKVENFPTSKNQHIFFQIWMNWNICSRGNFSGKSENFPLFQFFRKLQNFIHPGPEVCQFSDRLEKVEIFPVKSDELEHLLKVENFPIWKHRKMFLNWIFAVVEKFPINRKIFHFANSFGKSSTLPTLKKKLGKNMIFCQKIEKSLKNKKNCELLQIFYIK